jgi:hypothetical protein
MIRVIEIINQITIEGGVVVTEEEGEAATIIQEEVAIRIISIINDYYTYQ